MNKFDCSDEEYAVLYNEYGDLIKNFANKYIASCTDYEYDDMIQEGVITMLKAKKMYKKNNDATFFTYLYTAIRRRFNKISKDCKIINEEKKKITKKLIKEECSLDSHKLSKDKDLCIMLKDELKNMPDLDKKILKMKSEGRTLSEIGNILNVTGEWVRIKHNKAIEKIKRKLCKN